MATAKLKTGGTTEMSNEELYELIMSDSEKLDTFQSETPRQPRRNSQRETVSTVQNNI
jgi:hypothetical protein